jgi:ABC-type nickel/cobalt efflux system permease component RcnA
VQLFKMILLTFSFLLIIGFFLFLILRARRESIKVYSLHAFLSSHSYDLEDHHKKSLLDTINEYFEENHNDEIADDDLGAGGDDAGE